MLVLFEYSIPGLMLLQLLSMLELATKPIGFLKLGYMMGQGIFLLLQKLRGRWRIFRIVGVDSVIGCSGCMSSGWLQPGTEIIGS